MAASTAELSNSTIKASRQTAISNACSTRPDIQEERQRDQDDVKQHQLAEKRLRR